MYCVVDLGWIDIHVQVAMLSRYFAYPRQVHLEAVFRIFPYVLTKLLAVKDCIRGYVSELEEQVSVGRLERLLP